MNFNVVLFSTLAAVVYTTASQCSPSGQGSFIEFKVTTWRNATGHRIVKNDLYFSEGRYKNKTANWDVKLCTKTVQDVPVVHFSSLLSIPELRQGPPGYELFPGIGWYRLHLESLNWEQAKSRCEDEGAHLAVLNSQQEADVLKTIFRRAPKTIPGATNSNLASIGYRDIEEGQYLTIFGQTLKDAGYNVWSEGQPNNGQFGNDTGSDCGGIERSGMLNDIQCSPAFPFFCEYPL